MAWSAQTLLVGAYFELSFLGCGFLIHLFQQDRQPSIPTGTTTLDSEPRGRRYVKNMGHNRNRLYSRAIRSPTSMEKHDVQWFILKSV